MQFSVWRVASLLASEVGAWMGSETSYVAILLGMHSWFSGFLESLCYNGFRAWMFPFTFG